MGHLSPSHHLDKNGHSLFLLNPVRARGTSISPGVLYKSLLLHELAREAGVWVEVEDKAQGSRL